MFLKEQQYVCALADTGSMTKAAERLFITQPALTAFIRNLEKTLGVALFKREGGRYVPTLIGEKYIIRARQMLALQDEFNLDLALSSKGILGRVRIGMQSRRSPIILAPILRYFNEHYPAIEVIIEEGNADTLLKMLREKRIDFIMFSADNRDTQLDYIDIYPEELLLALPANHPASQGAIWEEGQRYPVINMANLTMDTFFLPRPEQSLRQACDRLFFDIGFTPRKVVEIRNIETVMTLVSAGLGVGFNRAGYSVYMNRPATLGNLNYFRVNGDKSQSMFVIASKQSIRRSREFSGMQEKLAELLRTEFITLSYGLHNNL